MNQLEMQLYGSAGDRYGASLSDDRLYRYLLWREWESRPKKRGYVLWVMLNPSTADASGDDPTVRKCIGFSKRWGYGRLEVVNLYAYRATKPKAMWEAEGNGIDIVGPLNERAIEAGIKGAALIVAAWGAGAHEAEHDDLVRQLQEGGAMCLGRTAMGEPRHPLMLSYDTELVPL